MPEASTNSAAHQEAAASSRSCGRGRHRPLWTPYHVLADLLQLAARHTTGSSYANASTGGRPHDEAVPTSRPGPRLHQRRQDLHDHHPEGANWNTTPTRQVTGADVSEASSHVQPGPPCSSAATGYFDGVIEGLTRSSASPSRRSRRRSPHQELTSGPQDPRHHLVDAKTVMIQLTPAGRRPRHMPGDVSFLRSARARSRC